jgi:LacI family transcriptional regulator
MNKLTMQKIADELGLSRTTVSLVLKGKSGHYRISEETKNRILDHIAKRRFEPNYFAQALNTNRSASIGLVFPDVFEYFMSSIIRGIENPLYKNNYSMMLCTSRFNYEMEIRNLNTLKHRGIDGLLLAFCCPFKGQTYSYDHIIELINSSLPVVLVDRYLPGIECPSVIQDDFYGAFEAVKLLHRMKCSRIGFISFNLDISSISDRYNGYCESLKELNLSMNTGHSIWLNRIDPGSNDLQTALKTVLNSTSPPDSFLITTQGLANKTAMLLESESLAIGRDIQIARFGNNPEYPKTRMISIEHPHQTMGQKAAEILLDIIENKAAGKKIKLKPQIILPDGGNHNEKNQSK